jgi:tetratricopeptide (TPR) repeat protein
LSQQALSRSDGRPETYGELARFLVICPAPRLRDPARAIDWAKKAIARRPDQSVLWNTLGMAYYRKGEWKTAVETLEESVKRQGENSFNWFFLAMAHQRLGNLPQARKYYDQALQWMEKNKPGSADLHRYRKEAALLLGVPMPPTADSRDPEPRNRLDLIVCPEFVIRWVRLTTTPFFTQVRRFFP